MAFPAEVGPLGAVSQMLPGFSAQQKAPCFPERLLLHALSFENPQGGLLTLGSVDHRSPLDGWAQVPWSPSVSLFPHCPPVFILQVNSFLPCPLSP